MYARSKAAHHSSNEGCYLNGLHIRRSHQVTECQKISRGSSLCATVDSRLPAIYSTRHKSSACLACLTFSLKIELEGKKRHMTCRLTREKKSLAERALQDACRCVSWSIFFGLVTWLQIIHRCMQRFISKQINGVKRVKAHKLTNHPYTPAVLDLSDLSVHGFAFPFFPFFPFWSIKDRHCAVSSTEILGLTLAVTSRIETFAFK